MVAPAFLRITIVLTSIGTKIARPCVILYSRENPHSDLL